MPGPPDLVDRAALAQHRRRAARAPALFLHEAVADEAQERLSEVNRTFTAPAVVTPWPEVWRDRLPGAAIVPDDEVLAWHPGRTTSSSTRSRSIGRTTRSASSSRCAARSRPDGLLLAATLGGQTLAELRAALAEAEVAD